MRIQTSRPQVAGALLSRGAALMAGAGVLLLASGALAAPLPVGAEAIPGHVVEGITQSVAYHQGHGVHSHRAVTHKSHRHHRRHARRVWRHHHWVYLPEPEVTYGIYDDGPDYWDDGGPGVVYPSVGYGFGEYGGRWHHRRGAWGGEPWYGRPHVRYGAGAAGPVDQNRVQSRAAAPIYRNRFGAAGTGITTGAIRPRGTVGGAGMLRPGGGMTAPGAGMARPGTGMVRPGGMGGHPGGIIWPQQ